MICIVDYGTGNLGSIRNMIKRIGYTSTITSDPNILVNASKIILPGVGSFDFGMKNLIKYNLIEIMNHKVQNEKIPILGICLGFQLMSKRSDEGELDGLGWFNAETISFDFSSNSKKLILPHMGWNKIKIVNDCLLSNGMNSESKFYFVHKYHIKSFDKSDINMNSNYGYDFVCSMAKDNILGVQFHPEKSHKWGMKLFDNFLNKY